MLYEQVDLLSNWHGVPHRCSASAELPSTMGLTFSVIDSHRTLHFCTSMVCFTYV